MKQGGIVQTCIVIARGVLNSRDLRRKMMMQQVIMLVLAIALGTWLIDDWLDDGPVRFLVFWGGVGLFVVMLCLFCIYDMLKAWKEEVDEDKKNY
ncbi:hypothetical protein SAMN02745181_2690 [Rubritalea squalenifaciens DSM 18772]|uniref:Uncharacterized protein n=1 Tax=Rubritalea squalenifaciens DSM 18772 TaxID=1123071 RepID=A0A1M6MCZ6_9BACT|nr:hypothetical protein [Rubritalea squalenifaciens]SHJ81279.1 hypothetical protein SAMN02745181_2690 [Rubritalea squalenifaciens DSM 18772]